MSRISTLASRPKRTLGALVVILAAVGVTVGSGANFTAQQANAGNIFASGSLSIGRDNSSAILTMTNMKPGDSAPPGQITVQNTGTVPGDFFLNSSYTGNAAFAGDLDLQVVHCNALDTAVAPAQDACTGTDVYNAKLSAYPTSGIALDDMLMGTAPWPGGNKNRYEFKVTFPNGTPANDNALEGKSVTATFTWKAQTA